MRHVKLFEDWGSSDWYAIKTTMQRSMKNDQASFEDAAYYAAETFYEDMGCENPSEAYHKIKERMKELDKEEEKDDSSMSETKQEKPYTEKWNPDWKGDSDDPQRWKGW